MQQTKRLEHGLVQGRDGCEKVTDGQSLKMKLRTVKMDGDAVRRSLQIVNNKQEPMSSRVFAVQSLARLKSPEGESTLLKIVSQKDNVLSFPALKSLAVSGTPGAFRALTAMAPLPVPSMDRQKDFAALMIAYRHKLPGTEPILARLLKDAGQTRGRKEEFRLKFEAMKPAEIGVALRQANDVDENITLSRKLAFSVEAGGQQYIFAFNNRLDDPDDWEKVLGEKQVIGQLLRREPHTKLVAQHYVALATPGKDGVQISFFRNDGELFMLANVLYDRAKKTFVVSNVKEEGAKDLLRTELRLDPQRSITMSLSYIRRQPKRDTNAIAAEPLNVRGMNREG